MKKLRTERKLDALLDGGSRYCGVAAAIVGGAIIGGVASNSASSKGAKAADHAADISDKNFQQTRADQLGQYAQQRADSEPYRQAGYGALAQLNAGLVPGGDFNRNFTLADFNKDPGYGFRQSEGEKGINRAAIAGGGRYSGATLKSLTRFNGDLASQEYGNAFGRFNTELGNRFNRLSGVAGTGQTAVAQIGQAGQNAFSNIGQAGQNNSNAQGNAAMAAGAARASGYTGVANSINSGIGQYTNYSNQQQFLNQMNQTPPPPSVGEYSGYGGAGGLY